MSFVHLHCHSHYSLLDGLPKIDDLISRAQELGMDALALTDHGVMYGILEFYKKAKDAGIKPILGAEAYLAPGSRKDRKAGEKPYHQILYAKDLTGYKNLMRLISYAHLEGFYYKPRLDKELLEKFHEGIIATSSCLQGEIPQAILGGNLQKAAHLVKEYQKIFGKENFYLEVQPHPEIPEQIILNETLFSIAKECAAPIIATNDSHYAQKGDAEAQDILVCVQTGKTVDEKNRLNMTDVDLSMKSEQEMRDAFKEHPEVIDETAALAKRCTVELELGAFHFPLFELPEGVTADEHLATLTYKGLTEKHGERALKEYTDRIAYELDIIKTKGYAQYFLIVADFGNWSRKQGIITTVRGSAAGSLVSYLIGITTVDPMTYHLPFERFLNPYRPSAPDIDMDFADNRRAEVLEYVKKKYGEEKVAQICTFGTMMARGAVRDVGRALGYPYAFCDRIAKMIPMGRQGFPMTIERAISESAELKDAYVGESDARRLLEVAKKLEGCARHPSVHAAGVVIAPTELTDFTPLQKETGGGDNIITQYDMHAVEEAGLVKMDFLGIRNLSILGNAVDLVQKTKKIEVNIETIPLDDKKTFSLLAKGRTMGMFQLGGGGMTRYLVELRPTKITDIMAMVALFRPGPMESIPEFIRRKHNPETIAYLDDRLAPILKDSYGIITYQDDVLYIAIEVAGYNWEEADKLRKAMGKKIPEEMAKQKDKFIKGCIEHSGFDPQKAHALWKLIEPFAAYGFNKAHASSYGIVAYQTAYMKAHFPAEFMAALMTAESDDIEKVAEAVNECESMGIKVLPPDINESFSTFTVIDDHTIRFGLCAIKNIGTHIVSVIIEERKKNGAFTDITEFLNRIIDKDLNKKSLESFIKSGSLDRFAARHTLYHNTDLLLAYAKQAHEAAARSQSSLFASDENTGKRIDLIPHEEEPKTSLQWEKELLGLYVSGHPLDQYRDMLALSDTAISDITASHTQVTLHAIIQEVKEITTKKGDLMAFVTIEDLRGSIEAIVFPAVYKKTKELLRADELVTVTAKVENRSGVLQLLCDRIETLDPESSRAQKNNGTYQRLEIFVPSNMPKETFTKLKDLFYTNAGKTSVILRINGTKKVILPHKVHVHNDFLGQVAKITGDQSKIRIH